MIALPLSLRLVSLLLIGMARAENEYGTYRNPNPLPQDVCDSKDLIKLNSCSNEMLGRLQQCKANDRACECCALQSLKPACFDLCPGSPASSLLAVIIQDCESLSDVNACDLPFKKTEMSYLSIGDISDTVLSSKYDLVAHSKQIVEAENLNVVANSNATELHLSMPETNLLYLAVSNSSNLESK